MIIMRQRTARPSETGARKKFRRFRKEDAKPFREAKVEETEAVKEIRRLFNLGNYSARIDEELGNIHYTAQDVEKFSTIIPVIITFNDDNELLEKIDDIEYFISLLVKHGKEKEYVIHSHSFGPQNDPQATMGDIDPSGKTVTIKGDVYFAGTSMESGLLIIEGNADNVGDSLKGGKIIVKGSAGIVGNCMEGGEIIVENDARTVGYEMKGGKIKVHGNVLHSAGSHGMKGGLIEINGNSVFIGFDPLHPEPAHFAGGKIIVNGSCHRVTSNGGELIVNGSVTRILTSRGSIRVECNGPEKPLLLDEELQGEEIQPGKVSSVGYPFMGEIHVNGGIGEFDDLSPFKPEFKGRVFQKGKLVVDRGKLIVDK